MTELAAGPASRTVTVFACGNRSRGDDAAALLVADALASSPHAAADVRAVGLLEPADLVSALRAGPCLILDAVRGIAPGAIVELPLRALLDDGGPTPASSHALPMPTIVGLAEALGAPLDDGTFIGIGGTAFELGATPSPAVASQLDALVAAVAAHLEPATEGASRCA